MLSRGRLRFVILLLLLLLFESVHVVVLHIKQSRSILIESKKFVNQNPAGLLHQILEDLLAMIFIICGFFFIVFPLYDTQIATSVFSTLYYSNQDMD